MSGNRNPRIPDTLNVRYTSQLVTCLLDKFSSIQYIMKITYNGQYDIKFLKVLSIINLFSEIFNLCSKIDSNNGQFIRDVECMSRLVYKKLLAVSYNERLVCGALLFFPKRLHLL